MSEFLLDLAKGKAGGIPSYCTASPLVIEVCLRRAKESGRPVLIEATANQVNQFGGYTGMQPWDFAALLYKMADSIGLPRQQLLLGGDHLGPLVWSNEPASAAMEKAEALVRSYVEAGFEKIHLDTSMHLGDDDPGQPLGDEIIARRGARLCAACEAAFFERKAKHPSAVHPVYVIGSEVPIPGGATEKEDGITVTSPEALLRTYDVYKTIFSDCGLDSAWRYVIGIVVQPGVEFGDETFFVYHHEKASRLVGAARGLDHIVLEGHSTDYQPRTALAEMVRDGIAILKVGPALTFAMREALFSLSMIEKELLAEGHQAKLPDTLERIMLKEPVHWERHYHGSEQQLRLKRKYSFSDRSRYYFAASEVQEAIEALFKNLDTADIPLPLLHQYMPFEYEAVCRGEVESSAKALVSEHITAVLRDYEYAAFGQHMEKQIKEVCNK